MRHPTRRRCAALLAGGAAAAALAPRRAAAALPPEQQAVVDRVEAYLDAITTLAADFRQTAPDGSLSTGKLFIDRPRAGMRFDYDPPSKVLLVAPGDWRLVFYDGSIQQVNVIPLAETPLGFLLQERVRLSGGITVGGVREAGDAVEVALSRTGAPDQGRVVLALAARPTLALRSWTVTDAQGLTTSLALENVRTGLPLDRSLFVWRDPKLFGWPED